FFFFQAEDGIRDRNVTGVQTCALPISRGVREGPERHLDRTVATQVASPVESEPTSTPASFRIRREHPRAGLHPPPWPRGTREVEIGRASCRERVEIREGAVAGKKKTQK